MSTEKEQNEQQETREERNKLAEERTRMAEERSEMAEERTDWAEHRTLLANERNFSAWIRTGLSAMGGGLAVAEFLGGEEASLLARIIGVLLVVMGAGVCALAYWRYSQVSDVLEAEGMHITPRWVVWLLVGGLIVTAFLVLVIILLQ